MDEKEKLYNELVKRDLYSKSFQEFDKQFSSPDKVNALHSTLKERGLVSIPADSFQSKFFGDLGEEPSQEPPERTDVDTQTPTPEEETTEEPGGFGFAGSGISELPGQVVDFFSDPAQIGEAVRGTLRSGLSGFGGQSEGLGIAFSKSSPFSTVTGASFQALGKEIQNTARELFPNDPDVQDNFINTVIPEALGSTASFIAAGAVGGAPASAAAGGFQLGAQAYNEALQSGADEETAFTAFLANFPLGGLEALPIARLFKRVDTASGGVVKNILRAGVGGLEEALQESGQQFLSNFAAQNIYDETRELLQGVSTGGGAGFAVGFLLNGLGISLRNIKSKSLSPEEKAQVKQVEKLIKEKRTEIQAQQILRDNQRELSKSFDESLIEPLKITEESEQDADRQTPIPPRLDDTASEEDSDSKRRGRSESREEKSGFNRDFLKKVRENTEQYFKSVSNEGLRGEAKNFVDGLVDEFGLDQALEVAREVAIDTGSPIALAQKFAIGREVIKRLNNEHVRLIEENDPSAVNISDKKLRFIEDFDQMATDAGRAIQSLNYGAGYLPQDFIRIYERIVNEYNEGKSLSERTRRFFREKILRRDPVEVKQEVIDEITKRASKLEEIPEGQFREEAARDIFRYIDDNVPTNLTNIGVAVGYANILSSHETQAVNFGNTGMKVLFDAITLNMANPDATSEIWGGLLSGLKVGVTEGGAALKTGTSRKANIRSKGLKELRPLERLFERIQTKEGDTGVKKAAKTALRPIAALRWISRIMIASDVFWFSGAEQMRQAVLARQIVKKEGLTDQNEISKRINEILHRTDQLKSRAEQQAEEEGFTGFDKKRRVVEIIDQNKPIDLQLSAQEFGNKARYTQEPEGVLGVFATGFEHMTRFVPPLKLAIPFTRVVANVANNIMDYSPIGYTRTFAATKWGAEIKTVPKGDLKRQQFAKATLGTMALGAAAAINAMFFDDDEPPLYIHGRGPQNFRDRFQLQESGWKEYSIQTGSLYFSFKETIFAGPLAIVGNYYDAIRYDDLDEEDITGRVAFALNNSPRVFLDQSFLVGVSDLFTAFSEERLVSDQNPAVSVINKVARPFAVPNLVKKIDQMFDPRVMTSDDIKESLIRDLPVARQIGGKPIINVLGEPIRQDYEISERVSKRFFSIRKSDPIWRMIARKKAFISHPRRGNTKITDRNGDVRDMNPDEYYNFMLIRGQRLKRTIRANLGRFNRLPDDKAQELMEKLSRNATSSAKSEMRRRRLIGKNKKLSPN